VRFVLVHGGFHGAWCWDKVVPQLAALSHDALAIDLPGHGERVQEKATLDSWRAALETVVEEGDVLVGHSIGGWAISLAADQAPDKVGRLIYLAARAPVEGKSMMEAISVENAFSKTMPVPLQHYTAMIDTPEQGGCIVLSDADAANKLFYHDCSPADQAWAFERLTPQPMDPMRTPVHLSHFWLTPIPRNYIFCTQDRSHSIEMANASLEQLGLTRCVGLATSHSPFLSQPGELAKLLHLCACGTFD
jgi:pimeloyl-ACP methyl ester carboxylesterase